ncbi:DUF924 family protein [Mameliella sediminis]|uniref:DUF924 family protein n=1 Tax=Mameliella sediminis TaxID=2836866 RepID=UPI001C46BB3B|nr:DUF924 family protein [Mameliella sediminis]MBY6116367.1 DUF924 domain-containing protein [Antarctobacter heliothermus]MBY6145607.1 DUF924 domain-containing protein [Mameliella alba]MBV7393669.1 DUF924 domain-containing protein [Mameliella sediminis]MBY6160931.1 DUF924 domain-containing protein [Mameliella alba]MBY6169401.1 DUF924 domain-containing protein [Mameliella alba]
MSTPDDILAFWLDEVGPKGWYAKDDALDAEIAQRFGPALEGLMQGRYGLWLTYPSGALAYIILADQFPRNMYREDARAYAADEIARAAAKQAIHRGWDMKIDVPARQFFYLPLSHSENLCDQDRCVRLIKERMPEAEGNLLHARAHREVIRMFGRFPHRNAVMARNTTEPEQGFLDAGGYGATLRELQQRLAA